MNQAFNSQISNPTHIYAVQDSEISIYIIVNLWSQISHDELVRCTDCLVITIQTCTLLHFLQCKHAHFYISHKANMHTFTLTFSNMTTMLSKCLHLQTLSLPASGDRGPFSESLSEASESKLKIIVMSYKIRLNTKVKLDSNFFRDFFTKQNYFNSLTSIAQNNKRYTSAQNAEIVLSMLVSWEKKTLCT